MGKSGSYLRLMRPVNCVMMGFAVIVGAALAAPDLLFSSWLNLIYGFTTGFALTAASMVINDCYDREIDAINEPSRPIPSGAVRPREALLFALLLTSIGFAAGLLTSSLCFAVALIAWFIFVAYTTVGKRSGLPGNLLVSICVTIPFLYGSIAMVGDARPNVLFFASMVFFSNTGREVTKGIVDVKGDKARNVKTIAVRYGERMSAIVASIFYLLAVSLSPIPWFLGLVSILFIPLVALTDIGLLTSSFWLIKDCSRENARKVKKIVLMWFLVGLLAFVLGAVKVT